jgi:hypothetical protein
VGAKLPGQERSLSLVTENEKRKDDENWRRKKTIEEGWNERAY